MLCFSAAGFEGAAVRADGGAAALPAPYVALFQSCHPISTPSQRVVDVEEAELDPALKSAPADELFDALAGLLLSFMRRVGWWVGFEMGWRWVVGEGGRVGGFWVEGMCAHAGGPPPPPPNKKKKNKPKNKKMFIAGRGKKYK